MMISYYNESVDNQNKNLTSKSVFHLITGQVPEASPKQTVAALKKEIVNPEKLYDSINYIYVLDPQRRLVGVLSIKELLQLPENTRLDQVMQTEIVFVRPHTHQENAVHLALKHNIKQIPVLDKDNVMLGVVASDTLLKITNKEIEESMLRLHGIYSKEFKDVSTLKKSAWHLTGKRLPWLILGLAGGIFASQIIKFFEVLLERETILVSFLPLMVYMSDAVGGQSQTIFIRHEALSTGTNFASYFAKEVVTGALIALVLSSGLGTVSSLIYNPYLGMVLGVSLFCTIIFSIIVAIMIPWLLIRFRKDPAVGSGPFATIIRDISSILIYFAVSSLFYK